jgi:hypothetical protein
MMAIRKLSRRDLAKDLGVSEGTIRNYLRYAKAESVRNGYAPGQSEADIAALRVKQVRNYLRLPEGDRDAWLDRRAGLAKKGETQTEQAEVVARGPEALKAKAGELRGQQQRRPTAARAGTDTPKGSGSFTVTLPLEPRALGRALADSLVARLGSPLAVQALAEALARVHRSPEGEAPCTPC